MVQKIVKRPQAGWQRIQRVAGRICLLLWACSSFGVRAVTLEEMRGDPRLTPEQFAGYFSNFRYAFHKEVQRPETFLNSKTGDCDDYAILAAEVLREKGYHPRLIAVRMPGQVHVVCYVDESKGYLDYNYRGCVKGTIRSDGTLTDIAIKVARSFDTSWTSASEFTFANGIKQIGATVTRSVVYRTLPLTELSLGSLDQFADLDVAGRISE